MIVAWVLSLLFAFGIGVLAGLYFSTKSVSTARHRQPVSPRPVLMPPSRAEDQPTKSSVIWNQEERLSPETLAKFERDLDEAIAKGGRNEFLRDYVDTHSTADEMEKGHWEGVKGTLEPKVLRPEETSSSLLGLSQGEIRPTANVKPVFGETEHLAYEPDDYEEPLICEPCKRPLVKGETFWAVSLPEEGEDVFIPICDECEAKSHD